jgi:phosphoserine phosphatase
MDPAVKVIHRPFFVTAALVGVLVFISTTAQAADPLPSWNEGRTKQAILNFVTKITTPGSPNFLPPAQRIAVFDNDGTLWAEQPVYFQLCFAIDRVKALAPQHPEWKQQMPYSALLAGDFDRLHSMKQQELLDVVMTTHAGMTTDEFDKIVRNWIATAKHPQTGKLLTKMVYQPMLELLDHLRANGFKTYIVSGGGVEFMRPWAEAVYGIPPEQVIGSSIRTVYESRGGKPVIVRKAELEFLDDKEGKPLAIHKFIGRPPVMAFGNSDGDYQMLEWTTRDGSSSPRFGMIIHHTDAAREFAYDRKSHVGKLSAALDDAPARGWVIVDMKSDWKTIFPAD